MYKLIDLKRKAKKTLEKQMTIGKEQDHYPYQMNITLEDEELKKLGKSIGDFKIGDDVDIISQAKVMSTRQSDEEYGNSRRSVSLQLRKMKLGK